MRTRPRSSAAGAFFSVDGERWACFADGLEGRRRGDVPDLTADPALAEKELGFTAPKDLETMCRDLWNWQTKNPQGYDTK